MFVSRMFVLLMMERYCSLKSYLFIINKINTHETDADSSTTTRLQVQCLNFQVCLNFSYESGWGRDIEIRAHSPVR